MFTFIMALFLVLHGLVHLLYFGQSRRLFALQPGMVWPDNSWIATSVAGDPATRKVAGLLCVLAAAGFVIGGIGMITAAVWWRPLVMSMTIFSSLIYLIFWDGTKQRLDNQGGIGILINIAIGIALLIDRI